MTRPRARPSLGGGYFGRRLQRRFRGVVSSWNWYTDLALSSVPPIVIGEQRYLSLFENLLSWSQKANLSAFELPLGS